MKATCHFSTERIYLKMIVLIGYNRFFFLTESYHLFFNKYSASYNQ
jgi:hypothetical protein